MKLTNEILQGIKIVKFYAWENSFLDRIGSVRDTELKVLRNLNMTKSYLIFFFLLLPIAVSLASFATLARIGGDVSVQPLSKSVLMLLAVVFWQVTPTKVFRAFAFFNVLQMPLVCRLYTCLLAYRHCSFRCLAAATAAVRDRRGARHCVLAASDRVPHCRRHRQR